MARYDLGVHQRYVNNRQFRRERFHDADRLFGGDCATLKVCLPTPRSLGRRRCASVRGDAANLDARAARFAQQAVLDLNAKVT
jgi:hypothetical protein